MKGTGNGQGVVFTSAGEYWTALDGFRYFSPRVQGTCLPNRPRRRQFKMVDIEQFHDVQPGTCIRCEVVCRAEKAHVIDLAWGGADTIENIVPLCYLCHHRSTPSGPDDYGTSDRMPIFLPGEEWKAWLFLRNDTWWGYIHAVGTVHLDTPNKVPGARIITPLTPVEL